MSEDESPYWTLLNAVKTYRDDTGQTIYEPFVKLPSKRSVHVFIASAFGKKAQTSVILIIILDPFLLLINKYNHQIFSNIHTFGTFTILHF
jgi:hypothetical protein